MSEEETEGFLSRWSRRKRAAVEAEAAPPVEAPGGDAAPDAPAAEAPEMPAGTEPAGPTPLAARAERPSCPIPAVPDVDPATLPPVESLTADSDFSVFLRPGVPTLLRNAALRRMWSLDPAIRDYIGPVDYQWDFNTPGGLPFGFANELGGEVKKLLAQAIGKLEELDEETGEGQEPEGSADSPAPAEAEPDPLPEEPPPALIAAAPPLPEPAPQAAAEPEPALAPAPRRRHGGALPA